MSARIMRRVIAGSLPAVRRALRSPSGWHCGPARLGVGGFLSLKRQDIAFAPFSGRGVAAELINVDPGLAVVYPLIMNSLQKFGKRKIVFWIREPAVA